MTIDGIQLLVNLRFIQVLVSFVRECTSPLFEDKETTDRERKPRLLKPSSPSSPLTRTQEREEDGKRQSIKISAKVCHPLIALLEDVRGMAEPAALVCQVSMAKNSCSVLYGAHILRVLNLAIFANLKAFAK